MPEVQYVPVRGERITCRMNTPKRVSELGYWFKAARKVIPQIPNEGDGGWFIASSLSTISFVRFDLLNAVGEKCYVVIDRTKPTMGM